ncbi:IS110 family transposase [Microlunatus aurantiacus]
MEVVCQRCAGIDVSKRDAKVCVRVQGRGTRRTSVTVRTWSSSMPQILRLAEELAAAGVELAVIESTSDYWRPFFYVLSETIPVMLVKASDVKGMPGRKSDVSDAEWLADLAAHGLVRPSFVPPEPQRQLRDLTRARVGLFAERTRELQRLEKGLEDACIKLSAVVSDINGVSARLMLTALINAERDPQTLAELARGRMRSKIEQLTEALTGRFNDHHRFMVQFRLTRIDQIDVDIATIDARIDELVEAQEWVVARELLVSVPGLGKHGAEDLLAEIGADMSVFPTPQALAAWVGVAPGSHESAGHRHPVAVRPGNRYAKRALGIAAKSAARMRSGFLAARFKRLCARRGYNKALVAIQHSMITSIWHQLSTGRPYRDLGGDYYHRHAPQQALRRKIKELEAAGYRVEAIAG